MTNHTERPDFPMDGMTADERRAATYSPKPARTSVAHQRYNDGAPVKATLGNFLAMSLGAATIIAVLGGLYLEFAALA
jgi:hypothetical protein